MADERISKQKLNNYYNYNHIFKEVEERLNILSRDMEDRRPILNQKQKLMSEMKNTLERLNGRL